MSKPTTEEWSRTAEEVVRDYDPDYILEVSHYCLVEGGYLGEEPGDRATTLEQVRRFVRRTLANLVDCDYDPGRDAWLFDLYGDFLDNEEALLALAANAFWHGWVGPSGLVEHQVPEWASGLRGAEEIVKEMHAKRVPHLEPATDT